MEEVKYWKATEFRQFLLYTDIFVLKNCIDDDQYHIFLLLHTGIRLLSCEYTCQAEAEVAQGILQEFVKLFSQTYGEHLVSFNIHGLLHICESTKQYGPLDNFSAYKFENYMQEFKKK